MGRSGPHGADRATNTTSQFMRRILRSATVASTLLALAVLLHPAAASAQAQKAEKSQKAKPYPLPTCVVSGEKLGGDMGDPHIFTYKGREIKLCCKSCFKDFNKEPAKFLKKLDLAAKTAGSAEKSAGQAHEDGPHKH